MTYDEIIKNRYSVRSFNDKKVDNNLIKQILEAGRIAPSAGNKQPTIVYILNENNINNLDLATKYNFSKLNTFLICYDKDLSYKRGYDSLDFGCQDASIVITHMMLKITDLGLGSCWVGSFDTFKLKEILNLPDNIIPVALLPFGYLKESSVPSIWHEDRKEITEFFIEL